MCKWTISRTYHFSAAHVIAGHPKCGRLHGHNYNVEVVVGAESLRDGMVLDYAELDRVVKPLIERFDHRFIGTRQLTTLEAPLQEDEIVRIEATYSTAEELTRVFFEELEEKFPLRVKVVEVSIWETSKSKATFRPR